MSNAALRSIAASYVLIWGDWISCDPLRGSNDSQSPHNYKETLVPHLLATLIYLSQIYSYYIRGDRSPLTSHNHNKMTGDGKIIAIECQYYVWAVLKHIEFSTILAPFCLQILKCYFYPSFHLIDFKPWRNDHYASMFHALTFLKNRESSTGSKPDFCDPKERYKSKKRYLY